MTTTAEPSATPVEAPLLDRAQGVELLGGVHGSGYKEGAALVRRGDGQMVHLGPLMYGLLECVDGRRQLGELAEAMSDKLGRQVGEQHVLRIAQKLAAQGLLAGTEAKAPPRRNPLLALRWKVLVTNPTVTRRLTAPFTFLFRPWLMWPALACFIAVLWFVLIHKGVASATAQAFNRPGLLLLVFALAVISAGFHELGHAAAARYGGATPGGMGMGLYLVWPAFYTDVTDAYRLPRRDRLRVDLGGLYFNAVVAVVTMAIWLAVRADALLLLIALQVLQMVKQLSPVIRADGYHILSDATGVPDLFSHMGPTMRRLLPWRRHESSALTGWARGLVTLWVLIVVPVLISLSLSAIILLPKLATTAYDSGRHIALAIPHQAGHGQILDLLASIIRLLALLLPVAGSVLVTQKILRTVITKARNWSAGRPGRRAVAIAVAAAAVAAMIWAWWPSGQYQPVRPTDHGTLAAMFTTIGTPQRVDRPTTVATASRRGTAAAPVALSPGRHLAVSMIPVGGATKQHPALFVIPGKSGKPAVAIISTSTPDPSSASGGSLSQPTTPSSSSGTSQAASPTEAAAFPFQLPAKPGPGDNQAMAQNTTNGSVLYDVAYSLVTVTGGAPVTNTNSAYALAHCQACTTVAVSFQVVLIVGQSRTIAPINAAGALNYNCPACTTTAVADQIVVTLKSLPSQEVLSRLETDLQQLNALSALGANGTPTAVAAAVSTVQQEIQTELNQSGLKTNQSTSTSTTTTPSAGTSSQTTTTTQSTTPSSGQTATTSTAPSDTSTAPAAQTTTTSTATTTTP